MTARKERILVVDDEKRIVENISLFLNNEGFQVSGAFDGEQALEVFRQEEIDLVLLDISMPGMSGYEVMEKIFELDEDVIVIIITGYASIESAIRALKIGAWDYLKKPFESADLIKAVKNALSQKQLKLEKKAVSARLEASEKQYAHMINNSPDLIFTLDQGGCFAFVNHQFENVLGFTKNEILGKSFEEILHPGDYTKAADLVHFDEDDLSSNVSRRMNFRFKKNEPSEPDEPAASKYDPSPYDSMVFMDLNTTPIHMPAGADRDEFKGVYVVARDVTEKVALEEQLRQSQKMEAIGTLAGGIAHDFNNVLMSIQGYASLVKMGFDMDSDEYRKLANIDEYVFNGAEMARQLLDFSQKSTHETARLNLNFVLKTAAKMFSRTKKNITISLNLEKKLWAAIVDEGQIKQVLMNLFVNAWQAMPEGGKIIIASENVAVQEADFEELGLESAGAYVKISVSDTGVGIDEEIINRIFDPFFTTKKKEQGTGLGLATTYGIIKSHQGVLKVESIKGEGSSFIFYLPSEEVLVDVVKTPESDAHANTLNGEGRILLVDDEKGIIEVCSEMLVSLGYKVKAVSSGNEALEVLNSVNPAIDLVILDMVMPDMSGLQTFEKIRAIDSEMKILVSSGYSRKEEIDNMMEKGCNEFILKPFDVNALSEKLKSAFGN